MAQQVYELNNNGVYGLENGVYADSLVAIIDDFEDADISEYGGETGSFSLTTTTVKNGSYALTATTGSKVFISSKSGLNAYPSPGDTFTGWFQASSISATESFVVFATQNATADPQGYNISPRYYDGNIKLYRDTGADRTQLASATVSWTTNAWYQIEVSWASDGTISVTLYDDAGNKIATLSATDTTYSSGGFGIGWNGGGQGWWDNFRIQ